MMSCVVFDFDGTLVDSNHIKRQTFYDIVRPYDPEGASVTQVLQQFSEKDRYGIFEEVIGILANQDTLPSDSDPKILKAQFAQSYTVQCERAIAECEEVPGASQALDWLVSQSIPLFINSRTPTNTLQNLLSARKLSHFFQGVYGAPSSKTQNLRLIQTVGGWNFQDMIFVGDSEDDQEAAQEVGCQFIGVVLPQQRRFTSRPNIRVNDLHQLRHQLNLIREHAVQGNIVQ